MFGECHGHIFMDGISYPDSVKRHQVNPDITYIRDILSRYQKKNVMFFRDGGDYLNVSVLAKQIAPEFGIDFRTPVFAIHKKGYYGNIVGRSFLDYKEYCHLIHLAKQNGCDFIKLMVSGILSYDNYGDLSCPSLPDTEIKELIHIAHEEGFSIMVHVNGDNSCRACIEAGADSLEHGFFMNPETIQLLAASDTIWVPTIAPSYAAIGSNRFPDTVLQQITDAQMQNVRYANDISCNIAAGSDAGAHQVLHGEGLLTEIELLNQCGLTPEKLNYAESLIQKRFKRK